MKKIKNPKRLKMPNKFGSISFLGELKKTPNIRYGLLVMIESVSIYQQNTVSSVPQLRPPNIP